MNTRLRRAPLLGPLLVFAAIGLAAAPARALTESQQDAAISSLQSAVASLQSTVSSQQTTINTLTAKLQYVTASGHDLTLTGNLHVVSGSGKTNGTPNGLGNVIIGYNEARTGSGAVNTRTGSHCLVLGINNNYSSYGGIVAGSGDTISAQYACVTGGRANTAGALFSSVSGGYGNTASGSYAAVGGGQGSAASAAYAFLPLDSAVTNLQSQITSINSTNTGQTASINTLQTSVNQATAITNLFALSDGVGTGTELTLSGVNLHLVNGMGATETENGLGNLVVGYNETRGGDSDDRTGSHNIVTGIYNNYSSDGGIVGGYNNSLSGVEEFCVGALNTASGSQSTVGGGESNTASGDYSAVGGGNGNTFAAAYAGPTLPVKTCYINADGTLAVGGGCTVSHTAGTGDYTITYPAGTFSAEAIPEALADYNVTGGFNGVSEPGDGSLTLHLHYSGETYILLNVTNVQ